MINRAALCNQFPSASEVDPSKDHMQNNQPLEALVFHHIPTYGEQMKEEKSKRSLWARKERDPVHQLRRRQSRCTLSSLLKEVSQTSSLSLFLSNRAVWTRSLFSQNTQTNRLINGQHAHETANCAFNMEDGKFSSVRTCQQCKMCANVFGKLRAVNEWSAILSIVCVTGCHF